jgi:hypothetical protein
MADTRIQLEVEDWVRGRNLMLGSAYSTSNIPTSVQLPEATSTGRALCVHLANANCKFPREATRPATRNNLVREPRISYGSSRLQMFGTFESHFHSHGAAFLKGLHSVNLQSVLDMGTQLETVRIVCSSHRIARMIRTNAAPLP